MPAVALSIDDLRHAYQILGVPPTSSAPVIKQAYRRLIKRWHPDLVAAGTLAQAEATQMTRLLNEAYAKVENAPLRYRKETSFSSFSSSSAAAAPASPHVPQRQPNSQTYGKGASYDDDQWERDLRLMARVEYWVRFCCGFLFGLFAAFVVLIEFTPVSGNHAVGQFFALCTVFALVSAFASARFGDRYWHFIVRDSVDDSFSKFRF